MPSRWVPKVSVCAEIFLPVIGQKSPEAVRKIISDVSIYHAYDKTVAIQTMVNIGVPSIAASLIARDPETVIALAYFKTAFVQEKGRITVKTEDHLVNVACIPPLIDRFLHDYDKRISAIVSYLSKGWLHEFFVGIIDSGDAAVPWLTEAIQYQTHPKLALELATKLGPNAVPALMEARRAEFHVLARG
jgi:hypothetical protein